MKERTTKQHQVEIKEKKKGKKEGKKGKKEGKKRKKMNRERKSERKTTEPKTEPIKNEKNLPIVQKNHLLQSPKAV